MTLICSYIIVEEYRRYIRVYIHGHNVIILKTIIKTKLLNTATMIVIIITVTINHNKTITIIVSSKIIIVKIVVVMMMTVFTQKE